MKNYKIFADSRGNSEAIKQGWSWPAFFFGPIWALIKQLWLVGFGFFGLFLALGIVEGNILIEKGDEAADKFNLLTTVIGLGVSITFGIKGNQWRESSMASRNFTQVDRVDAESPDAALARAVMRSRNLEDD